MDFLDTHLHLLYPEHFDYSWTAELPPLQKAFRLEDYNAALKQGPAGIRIAGAIFMEVDVDDDRYGEEARFFSALADRNDNPLVAVIAACRPEKANFRAQLEAFKALPRVKGLRRVLHTQPDATSRAPLFRENLRLLPEYGLSFDLCLPLHLLPEGAALVRACPETSFILDHCGVPDIKGGNLDSWRAHIADLAACSNLVCKVSGLVTCAADDWDTADLRPAFDHIIASFGIDRVVWGSDWPVCDLNADLGRWLAASLALTQEFSEADRHKLFHDNAMRVYRL